MNPIESLESNLKAKFPEARTKIDRPYKADGVWFLDIRLNGYLVIVQWQEGKDFGVSTVLTPDQSEIKVSYGEGVDETWETEEVVLNRISTILDGMG